ncbi:hypothetical protein FQA47_019394 [Oryzias melastigma]|uniref:Uncharacterized protein n=1 Tax=Oryzias melastigma TaxID=30732 RepID=A0A834C216_ORYME|nr:hypothetical protein FQA47_019394 [Oryzias melastigma]
MPSARPPCHSKGHPEPKPSSFASPGTWSKRTLAAKILRLSAALSLCQRLPSGMDSELFSPPRLARSFFTLSLQALRLGFPSVFCKCSWSGVAALC